MKGQLDISHFNKSSDTSFGTAKRPFEKSVAAPRPKTFLCGTDGRLPLVNHLILGNGIATDIGLFVLKMAALDIIRRFSKARCPFVWRGIQALQLLCYPPFKWLQQWVPKGVIQCMQDFSTPVLILSIATTFSDNLVCAKGTPRNFDASQESYEPKSESPPIMTGPVARSGDPDDLPQSLPPEKWLVQLHKELEKEGVVLPERINEDELRRFYVASNGDILGLLSSIKKTIRWRQTYTMLSMQELEVWSDMIFWHGRDIKLQPCLILRLGLACSSLASSDKAQFAKAVVSQIEYGVLHLVDAQNSQITVLMDCKGLSPFHFPVQIMRSIAILLQDHYPNRLGCLFVVRLPPVARVIIQTLTQVLKPITRKKLRIVGDNHQKVFFEYLQSVPSFLGGECSCPKCSDGANINPTNEKSVHRSAELTTEDDYIPGTSYELTTSTNRVCNQVLKAAIIGALILWLLMAVASVMSDP